MPDKAQSSAATPGHWFGPRSESSFGSGHPVMFGKPQPARHFDTMPDGGGYPKGFVEWALGLMGCDDPDEVLHVCSGSMRTGVRVDVRHEMQPTVVADGRALPFRDGTFRFVMIDPPYAEDYARNLYGTAERYPAPGALMAEACRVLAPGGKVGLLHFVVPMTRRPLRIRGVYGVTTGSGYAIRAWTALRARGRERPAGTTRGKRMIRDHLLIYHGWHPDYVRATTPERLAAGHEAEHRPYSEYLHTQKHDHLPAVSAQPDGEST